MIQFIHHQIEENLTIAFAQLGMPELVTDIDYYLRELGEIPVPPRWPTPYPSPPLLSQEAEWILRRTKLMYEISTQETLDGEFTLTSLQSDHPHYRETCFECHCLGHLWANCPYYKCPHYLNFSPDHSQCHFPCHLTSPPSLSSSSLGNSPIICCSTLCYSNRMISTNTSASWGNWHTWVWDSCSCSSNQYSTVDFDYNDSSWSTDGDTNISSSSSYRDFWLMGFLPYPSLEFWE